MQEEWHLLPDGRYVRIPNDISSEERDGIVRQLADLYPEEIGKPYYEAYDEYLKGQRTLGGALQHGLKNIVRGFGSAALAVPEAAAAVLTPHKDTKVEQELRDLSDRIMSGIPEEYKESEIAKIGLGLGQFAAFGASAFLGGLPAAFTLGGASGISEQARRISDYEKTTGEDVKTSKEVLALAGGAGVGFSEVIPVSLLSKRLGAAQKAVEASGKFSRVAVTAAQEAAQESFAEVSQAFISKAIYDDSALEDLGSRVLESARLGGEVGGIASVLTELALGYRLRNSLAANYIDAELATPRPELNETHLKEQEVAGAARAKKAGAEEGSDQWNRIFLVGVEQKKQEQINNLLEQWRTEKIKQMDSGATKKQLGVDPELLNPLEQEIERIRTDRIRAVESNTLLTKIEKDSAISSIERVNTDLLDQLNSPDEYRNPSSILNKWFSGQWDSAFEILREEYVSALDGLDIRAIAGDPNISDDDFMDVVRNDRISKVSKGEPEKYRRYLHLTEADETGFSAALIYGAAATATPELNILEPNTALWQQPTLHLQSPESRQARVQLQKAIESLPNTVRKGYAYDSRQVMLDPLEAAHIIDLLVSKSGARSEKAAQRVKTNLFNLKTGINFNKWVRHHNLEQEQIIRGGRTAGQPRLEKDPLKIQNDLKKLLDRRGTKQIKEAAISREDVINLLKDKNVVIPKGKEGTNILDLLSLRIAGVGRFSDLRPGKKTKRSAVQAAQLRAFYSHLWNLPTFDSEVDLTQIPWHNMRRTPPHVKKAIEKLRGKLKSAGTTWYGWEVPSRGDGSGASLAPKDLKSGAYPIQWYRDVINSLAGGQHVTTSQVRKIIKDNAKARNPRSEAPTVYEKQIQAIARDLQIAGHASLRSQRVRVGDQAGAWATVHELYMDPDASTRPPPSLYKIFKEDQDVRLQELADAEGKSVTEIKMDIDYDGVATRTRLQKMAKKVERFLEAMGTALGTQGLTRVMPLVEAEVGSNWDGVKGVLVNNNPKHRKGVLATFDGPNAIISFSMSNIDPEGDMPIPELMKIAGEEIDHAYIRYGYYPQRWIDSLLTFAQKNKVKRATDNGGFERGDTYLESAENTYSQFEEYTQKDIEEEAIVSVLNDIRQNLVAPAGNMGKAKRFSDKLTGIIRKAGSEADLRELADLIRANQIGRSGAGVGRMRLNLNQAMKGQGVRNRFFYDRTSPEMVKEMGDALKELRESRKNLLDIKQIRAIEDKIRGIRERIRGDRESMFKAVAPAPLDEPERIQNRMRATRNEKNVPVGDVPLVNPHASDIGLSEFYRIQDGAAPFELPEAVKYRMRRETSVTPDDYLDVGFTPPDPDVEPRLLPYEQVLQALGVNTPDTADDAFTQMDVLREQFLDARNRIAKQSAEWEKERGYNRIMAEESATAMFRLMDNAANAAAGMYYDGAPVYTGEDPFSGGIIFPEEAISPSLEDALQHIRDPQVEKFAIEYGAAHRIVDLDKMRPTIRNLLEGTEAHLIDLNNIVEANEKNLDDAIKSVGDVVRAQEVFDDIASLRIELDDSKKTLNYYEGLRKDLKEMLSASVAASRGMHGTPQFPDGMSPGDAQKIIKKIEEHPNPNISDNVNNFWNKFSELNLGNIQFAEDTKIVRSEIADLWRQMSYLPFYRDVESDVLVQASAFGGGWQAVDKPSLQEGKKRQAISVERPLVGSLEPMNEDLAGNLLKHSIALYRDGLQNISVNRVTREAKDLEIFTEGAGMTGTWKDQLKGAGEWTGRVRLRDKANNRTIRVLENGSEVFYEHVDPMLASAAMSLGFNPAKAMEEWLGGGNIGKLATGSTIKFSQVLRESITRTPAFQADNIWRDVIQAWTLVGGDADLFKNVVKNVFDLDAPARARRLGIAMSPDFLMTPGGLAKQQAKEFRRTRTTILEEGWRAPLRAAANTWAVLGRLANQSEIATRLAIAERVLAEGGTEAEAQYAGLEIMNYGRRGKNPIWNIVTAWNPFMNGRVVGLDTFYRGAYGSFDAPIQIGDKQLTPEDMRYRRLSAIVLSRLLFISSVSGLYYWMVHDEPWWQELTEAKKMDGIVIGPNTLGKLIPEKMFTDPLSKHLMGIFMPSPFEAGVVGYTLPVALMRAMFERDYGLPSVGAEAKRQLGTSLAFHIMPQIMRPMWNAYKNRDEFRGDVIIPPHYEEDVDPALQYDYRTSNVAHAVSSIFAKTPIIDKTFLSSPKKWEYMLRQYLGTMGAYATTMTDAMVRSITGQGVADTPMHFSGSMANIPPLSFLRIVEDLDRGGGYQEWFYELQGELDGVVATLNVLKERGEWDTFRKKQKIHENLLRHENRMRAHGNWMTRWRDQRDKLMSRRDLTREEEKERDRIYRDMRRQRIQRTKNIYDYITRESPSILEKIKGTL